MATVSRVNVFRVPKKQWNKWTPHAREIFNALFSTMRRNQGLFLHPEAPKASKKHWQTTAWNAAWMAADVAHGVKRITVAPGMTGYEIIGRPV